MKKVITPDGRTHFVLLKYYETKVIDWDGGSITLVKFPCVGTLGTAPTLIGVLLK